MYITLYMTSRFFNLLLLHKWTAAAILLPFRTLLLKFHNQYLFFSFSRFHTIGDTEGADTSLQTMGHATLRPFT